MEQVSILKQRAALRSLAATLVLTGAKLVAGLLSGSLALMSEAFHGLIDTGATLATYFAVRASGRPADDDHQFGHGKIEAVTALMETCLLAGLAAAVLFEAVRRLFAPPGDVVASPWVYGVLIVAIVVDAVRWRALQGIADKTGSHALAADALHFSSDLVASCLVLAGLVAAQLGLQRGDTFAAVGVGVFIAVAGWRLGRRTIDTLMDAAPKGLANKVRALAEATPGVVAVENVRLRPTGDGVGGEITIAVPRSLPLERVSVVKDAVMRSLAREVPDIGLTIQTVPRALDTESMRERVLLLAARRRTAIHHVVVQQLGEGVAISLDLELDGQMTLDTAHGLATDLESAIRHEFGFAIEVDTHIEPSYADELAGADATDAQMRDIVDHLRALSSTSPIVRDIHNVRARSGPRGLIVNYHCRVDPELTVSETHDAVDAMDRRLRAFIPDVARIVGHAEPLPRRI